LDGGFAYLMAPVTLTYIKAGKPLNFLGMITITLRKREAKSGREPIHETDSTTRKRALPLIMRS
jgi:hypothetical protein